MAIHTILVIGAGQMGSGIAQVAAQAGYRVLLNDVKEEFIERGIRGIEKNLARSVEKGKLSGQQKEEILGRIRPSLDIAAGKEADLAIEAAIENLDLKGQIYKALDKVCPPGAILASNTSSLPITELATFTGRPEKFIGMHFMNPVPVMQLVEVIRGIKTSDETALEVETLSRSLGKVPVTVRDLPGFALNRILIPMINEAIYCLYEGVSTPEGIDQVMKLGANQPMGPLELADLIGLDTCLAIMEVLYRGFGDQKYRPCPLLRQYVKAGWLGRKAGRGFYQY